MMKAIAVLINFIAGMIIQAIVVTVAKRFSTQIQKSLIGRVDRRLDKDVFNRNHAIVSIFHLYEDYAGSLRKLDMKQPGTKCFHFCVNASLKKIITDNTKWKAETEYLDSPDETERRAAKTLGLSISEFIKELSAATESVTNAFHQKIKANYPFFNGEMYGIDNIRVSNNDHSLVMECFRCDYYTHRIMAALYEKNSEKNQSIMSESVRMCQAISRKPGICDANKKLEEYKYFLTSLGVDILVYLEDENVIIMTKRSDKLFGMEKPRWHMSVNEAVSITDLEDNEGRTISLEKCVKRGIKEELGVSLGKFTHDIIFADMFMLKKPIELGISAFVRIKDISYSELKVSYYAAKDGEFETTNIMSINCSDWSIRRFLKKAKENDEITAAGEYLLEMFLARYNRGVFEA